MTNTNNARRHLDELLEDSTTPKALRQAIERHLRTYDRALELKRTIDTERRNLIAERDNASRNEPTRLIAALSGKAEVTVEDVGGSIDLLNRAVDLANERSAIARRTTDAAWNQAERLPFMDAIDEVLPWIAEHRKATPWDEPLPAHINYAWNRASGNYIWQMPFVLKRHRFVRLLTTRHTEAMRRTWAAYGTADVERLDNDDRGRHIYRVTAYWPDLLDEVDGAA